MRERVAVLSYRERTCWKMVHWFGAPDATPSESIPVFTWRPLFPDGSQSMLGMVQVLEPRPSGPKPNSSNRQLCLGDLCEPDWGSWSRPAGWTFYTRPLSSSLQSQSQTCTAGWSLSHLLLIPSVKDTLQAIPPKKSFVFLALSQVVLCRGAEQKENFKNNQKRQSATK